MSKIRIPAAALWLAMLVSIAPLSVYAPGNVSAETTTSSTVNSIKGQTIKVKMVFDGVSMQPPGNQYVFTYNNTTYVPLRFMSYALQKNVSWDSKKLKVTVTEPSSSELVGIKEYLMNATNDSSTSVKSIILINSNTNYEFYGNTKILPKGQLSYTLNGSLYVPLRFFAESVGNSINWNQETKTITAKSKTYQEDIDNTSAGNNGVESSQKPTPTHATTGEGSANSGNGKVSYESITSETEAKLNTLKSQSQSTLMNIAFEYLAAKDEKSKQSLKAKGLQQLNSFTASFNSIVADAEQRLSSNGYSTEIISKYRSAFESELQAGRDLAEGLGN